MGQNVMKGFSGGYDSRMYPQRHSPPAPCVYFVEARGTGLVKIGTIKRRDTIQERVAYLQTGCPYELRLALIVDGEGRRGEFRFHKALDQYRFRNEWFRREGGLAEILDLANSDPDLALEMAKELIAC